MDPSTKINIMIIDDETGHEVSFQCRMNVKLSKVIAMYCDRLNIEKETVTFSYNDNLLDADSETLETLRMEEGACIRAQRGMMMLIVEDASTVSETHFAVKNKEMLFGTLFDQYLKFCPRAEPITFVYREYLLINRMDTIQTTGIKNGEVISVLTVVEIIERLMNCLIMFSPPLLFGKALATLRMLVEGNIDACQEAVMALPGLDAAIKEVSIQLGLQTGQALDDAMFFLLTFKEARSADILSTKVAGIMLKRLESSSRDARLMACRFICDKFARYKHVYVRIRGIPQLVKLLSSDEEEVQRLVLRNIFPEISLQVLVHTNALLHVVPLLTSTATDIQADASALHDRLMSLSKSPPKAASTSYITREGTEGTAAELAAELIEEERIENAKKLRKAEKSRLRRRRAKLESAAAPVSSVEIIKEAELGARHDEAAAGALLSVPRDLGEVVTAAVTGPCNGGGNDDEDTCVVCMEETSSIMCAPCGHTVMCRACFHKVHAMRMPCPVCQTTIESTVDLMGKGMAHVRGRFSRG